MMAVSVESQNSDDSVVVLSMWAMEVNAVICRKKKSELLSSLENCIGR